MGKIWAVCSGSGGVGKTTIAVALAAGAARAGKQAILLDAAGAARACDLALRMESVVVLDVVDAMRDQVQITSALYPVPQYARLKLACASLHDDVAATELSGMALVLSTLCDVLVIDLPTGQGTLGRGVLKAGDERLLVTRADDASIRAAERVAMRREAAADSLILSRVDAHEVRRKTQYPAQVVENLLDRPAIACIPEDRSLSACMQRGKAAIECGGPAGTALFKLVKTLLQGA